MKTFLLIALFSIEIATSSLPVKQICNSKDESCIITAIQEIMPQLINGFPPLGVPSIDPIVAKKVSIGAGKMINLVQNYEELRIYGLGSCTITKAKVDLDAGKLELNADFPRLDLNGTYSVKGKIMVLEVYGNGPSMIRIEKPKAEMVLDLETYTKDNQKYLRCKNWTCHVEAERLYYLFENLFDGNKLLGDNINNVLNDNWEDIFKEMGPSYENVLGEKLVEIINIIFSAIPMKELFLD